MAVEESICSSCICRIVTVGYQEVEQAVRRLLVRCKQLARHVADMALLVDEIPRTMEIMMEIL